MAEVQLLASLRNCHLNPLLTSCQAMRNFKCHWIEGLCSLKLDWWAFDFKRLFTIQMYFFSVKCFHPKRKSFTPRPMITVFPLHPAVPSLSWVMTNVMIKASNELSRRLRFYNHRTETVPNRAFSWLKAPTSAFTFKTLC